jgi:hypothetical protein
VLVKANVVSETPVNVTVTAPAGIAPLNTICTTPLLLRTKIAAPPLNDGFCQESPPEGSAVMVATIDPWLSTGIKLSTATPELVEIKTPFIHNSPLLRTNCAAFAATVVMVPSEAMYEFARLILAPPTLTATTNGWPGTIGALLQGISSALKGSGEEGHLRCRRRCRET